MLVGRDRELTDLAAGLTQAAAARGSVFLLSGEPGIGKTRLAAEVASSAREQRIRALWGRCWEAGGAPAYWPWREAVEGLGLTFPEAGAIAAANPAEARFALFREVVSALGREATLEPLVIVLEDLHAADSSTLLLFEFVATAVRNLPIMVIGTYRDLEANLKIETGDALARIGRSGRVLHLSRLGEADVTTLVRDSIADADERTAATVYQTTQGNPLFVDEVVRQIRTHGLGAGAPVPLGVREIIRQRLALVSEEGRRALEAGAVLGVEFSAVDVGRMVPGAAGILDHAARAGLVTARGAHLRFTHALYREALYHDLPRPRRQELHQEAARALAATSRPLAETAHHLLEGGPEVAAEAIDHAIRGAAHALGVFAFEDAAALLERARAAIPHGPLETSLRCRVLIALGEARIRSGDVAGRALCVEAAEIARGLHDATLLALAGLAYGAVFTMGGVDPVLVGLLEDALARLLDEDSALRARVMARLGAARQPSPPALRARDIELALAAVAMARRVADRRELLGVLHSASGALYGAAHPAIRLPISREQERLAEELGDTTRLLHARVRLAMDHLELADFAAYEHLATSYEQLARRVGRAAAPWRAALMRSMVALSTDRFTESERWQDEARSLETEHHAARRAQGYHRLCFLRATERHAEMRASIPELRGLWMEMPYGVVLAEPRVASTLARIGADDEVRATLATITDAAFEELINATPLAEAVWATGDANHAARLLPFFAVNADRWFIYWLDVEIVEAPMTRLFAYLTAITGDWAGAERLFAQALEAVEGTGRRSMAARMRFELGDLMVRMARDPERARSLLADARAGAEAIGLPELVALIDRRHPRLAAPRAGAPVPFAMVLEGEYFAVATASGTLRFKASRGMHYLAHLVDRPGVEVHVLELAGSAEHADRGDGGEQLDAAAMRAYRARLVALRDTAEDADARGDADGAERARDEMEAIAGELARGTGLGGQARRTVSAVDRARSAVQRRIKDALDRIADQDAELGIRLRRAVTTGNFCSFRLTD